ncbi:MAG: hypothetical protein MRECE_39c018 [Mycoplasmataceae bacterium CE_OT135]|nr:MAG: hypothetical protein MRECE_39c018 [Mycoplasmataceae bacterium CE_OT135]
MPFKGFLFIFPGHILIFKKTFCFSKSIFTPNQNQIHQPTYSVKPFRPLPFFKAGYPYFLFVASFASFLGWGIKEN